MRVTWFRYIGRAMQLHIAHGNVSAVTSLCPASSSWQDFLGFECRGGGVGQAQVHLLGPVP